jgi:hypothetical protein
MFLDVDDGVAERKVSVNKVLPSSIGSVNKNQLARPSITKCLWDPCTIAWLIYDREKKPGLGQKMSQERST